VTDVPERTRFGATQTGADSQFRDSAAQPWDRSQMSSHPTAVDLFSGGRRIPRHDRSRLRPAAAADISSACGLTHTANLPGEFLVADLREVDAEKILTAADIAPGELGPPVRRAALPRLLHHRRPSRLGRAQQPIREVLRLADDLQPRCIVIEMSPAKAIEHHGGTDAIATAITRRLSTYLDGINTPS